MKRISITLPENTIERLNKNIKKGEVSNFVYQAIEEKLSDFLIQDKEKEIFQKIDEFRKHIKKKSPKEINDAIERGRK